MFRLILFLFVAFYSVNSMAVELISGSLDSLKNEYKIAISLDCSKCVFRTNDRNIPFEYFLAKAPRIENWETKSMEYFVDNFNEKTFNEGLMGIIKETTLNIRYELIIIPEQIFPNGNIKGIALIKNIVNDETIAELHFSAEGDDDDKVTLRDPMKELGNDIGNLFRKVLKGEKVTATKGVRDKYSDDIYY